MAHEPIHLHKKQEISGSFYRKDQKGYLDVDITIPKWAFCSGELVPLKGTIDNQSGGTVHLKTILEQQCLYKGVQFMGGPEEKMHTVEVMIWEHPESIPAHTKFEVRIGK